VQTVIMLRDRSQTRSVGWLYVGFALTGTGTTLLGCILPSLSAIWHMNDARAGIIFAAQFSGAALGSLLVGNNYFGSAMTGYLLLITSGFTLARFGDSFSGLFFLIFGLGLGLTMTATSMFISKRCADHRGAALSLLNACWALGAMLCPILASLWIRRWAPGKIFLGFSLMLVFVFSLIILQHSGLSSPSRVPPPVKPGPVPLTLIVAIGVVAFLYVGVEVSVSGWMMSYVHRLTNSGDPLPPISVSCFWIALLCGRAVTSLLLRRMSEVHLLTASVAAALISVSFLVLSRSTFGIVLGATCSGLTLGPVYPLCLARVLALAHDSVNTKWIFATSGFGGALLPWLTGKLSAYNGSLSVGLVVPLFALGTMFALQLYSQNSSQVPA
jgi:FHS family glucose/mannose:H+ symporter-like MFS transporter